MQVSAKRLKMKALIIICNFYFFISLKYATLHNRLASLAECVNETRPGLSAYVRDGWFKTTRTILKRWSS